MTTPTNGVKVTLDRERTLRYGGRALRAVEQETGKNLLRGEIGEDLNFSELVVFVWAGLLHEDPDLTVDDVADAIDLGRLEELVTAMNAALTEAGLTEGREGKKAKAARRSGGGAK